MAARRGEREKYQRGEEWGQGELGRLGGAPNGGSGGHWAGKTAAQAAGAAPVNPEVEDELGGLVCNL